MKYISIHRSAQPKGEWVYYRKGKEYTYEEHCKLVHRQQLIREIALVAVLGVIMVFRAYVFLEYGI